MRYIGLLLLLSFLPLLALFTTSQMPHTHDGPVHLARMAAYYKAINGGQLFPRWASDLNYGYGMPLFNFIYQTPYLIAALLISLGTNLVTAFKITIALSFIASGVGMFGFAYSLFKNPKKAFFITIFYQFAPFHLVEMMARGSFGEMYTYTFLPFMLWGLSILSQRPNSIVFVMIAIATALLIVSHNSISLIFFFIACFYVLFFGGGNPKKTMPGLLCLITGLLLAAFYWMPAVLEHKYTYGDLFMRNMYREHFPPLRNLLFPNIFNAKQFLTGGVSVQIGLLHTIVLIFAFISLLKKRQPDAIVRRLLVFSLIVFSGSIFLMLPISRFLWEKIALLRQFQFPWRLLSVTIVTTPIMASSLFTTRFYRIRWMYWLTLFLVVALSAYYWYPPLGFDRINDEKQFWDYPLNTTYFGETDLIWSGGPAKTYAKQPIEIVSGDAIISHVTKKSTIHTFTVQAQTATKLADNTQYFPGWRVYVDGKKVPVQFQDENWRGLITFAVPQGSHTVRVVLEKSPTQWLAESISFLTGVILAILTTFAILKKPH